MYQILPCHVSTLTDLQPPSSFPAASVASIHGCRWLHFPARFYWLLALCVQFFLPHCLFVHSLPSRCLCLHLPDFWTHFCSLFYSASWIISTTPVCCASTSISAWLLFLDCVLDTVYLNCAINLTCFYIHLASSSVTMHKHRYSFETQGHGCMRATVKIKLFCNLYRITSWSYFIKSSSD